MLKKLILPVIVAVALVGCGNSAATPTSSSQATGSTEAPLTGSVTVSVASFKYSPAAVVVKKGAVIHFVNNDLAGHSLTADDSSFDTDIIGKDATKDVTMNTVGTFKVHCKAHPSIQATVTVVE